MLNNFIADLLEARGSSPSPRHSTKATQLDYCINVETVVTVCTLCKTWPIPGFELYTSSTRGTCVNCLAIAAVELKLMPRLLLAVLTTRNET